ncbi:MAG: CoA transferase, partial [Deltaproteobacteria bacterium]|nr:CoA transferase [Deltaproteobacteria bacterium]
VATPFGDLGADVIKIESPSGDYIRQMTWPIIEEVSLMHYHLNRGKRSLILDLRTDAGREIFLDLAKTADAVIEGMRPGALAKRGVGYEELKAVNPKIVFCNISGYGATGPYQNMPAHGIAFDTWAGVVSPAYDEDGFCYIPEHVSVGINAGPIVGALGILAGVIRARETGEGCNMEFGQSDAAAYFDWYRSESYMAYRRPEDVVTGNKADGYKRRAVGTAGMKVGVRYQMYESSDGHILFMASEQAFWKNFCEGVGRMDLFEKWPGSKYADHASGNTELRKELREIFKAKMSQEWLTFSVEQNTPIAPVNTPENVDQDPQFKDRFDILSHEKHGADMISFPIHFEGEEMVTPCKAPTLGQDSDAVLTDTLGYSAEKIAELKAQGALGKPKE